MVTGARPLTRDPGDCDLTRLAAIRLVMMTLTQLMSPTPLVGTGLEGVEAVAVAEAVAEAVVEAAVVAAEVAVAVAV